MFVGAPFEASEAPVSQEERALDIVSDIAARKAIQIASYPKSGNAWVRVFLHKLMHELRDVSGAQDINMLRARLRELTGRESLDRAFAQRLGRPAKETTLTEIASARPLAQADRAPQANGPVLIKTPSAGANIEGRPTINLGVTRAAIYLLRNVVNVAVSYARHAGQTIDRVIQFLARPQAMNDRTGRHVYEFMGSWSFHVASWLSVIDRPVLILRYEDLFVRWKRSFARLARFLRLAPNAAQLRAAVEMSSFAALARQEEERGFNERPKTAEKFFRKGEAGQWKEALSRNQVARIVAAHGPMIMRFGYAQENCDGEMR